MTPDHTAALAILCGLFALGLSALGLFLLLTGWFE